MLSEGVDLIKLDDWPFHYQVHNYLTSLARILMKRKMTFAIFPIKKQLFDMKKNACVIFEIHSLRLT
jgi:hypothetical protein